MQLKPCEAAEKCKSSEPAMVKLTLYYGNGQIQYLHYCMDCAMYIIQFTLKPDANAWERNVRPDRIEAVRHPDTDYQTSAHMAYTEHKNTKVQEQPGSGESVQG